MITHWQRTIEKAQKVAAIEFPLNNIAHMHFSEGYALSLLGIPDVHCYIPQGTDCQRYWWMGRFAAEQIVEVSDL